MTVAPSLLYVSNSEVPSAFANTVQVMNMCHALTGAGFTVDLLARQGRESIDDVFAHYDLPQSFRIHRLPLGASPERGRAWWIARAARKWLSGTPAVYDCIYTRNPWLGRPRDALTLYESHHVSASLADPTGALMGWRVCRDVARGTLDHVVCISDGLRRQWSARGVPANRLSVMHDAVDTSRFVSGGDPASARMRLGWPAERRVAMLCGQLVPDRGSAAILDAAALTDVVDFVLVGGLDTDIERCRAEARRRGLPHVRAVGRIPHVDVPRYLAAADILLMPYSSAWRYAEVASPLKLFEYLAVGRPIVASDLPATREVLTHGDNALLVPPDDPRSLGLAVERLAADDDLARRLAAAGRASVAGRTWARRAANIRELIDRLASCRPESLCTSPAEGDRERRLTS